MSSSMMPGFRFVLIAIALTPFAALAGTEAVLHTFKFDGKGDRPFAALTQVGKKLYGTTGGGGSSNNGTVFAVTPAGGYHVIYAFAGGAMGSLPSSALIKVGGTLYGTTLQGGEGCNGAGCGTVFSITPGGTFNSLYAFKGGADGAFPVTGLAYLGGTLYGTTSAGGGAGCGGSGCGTVFSLTLKGEEQVLHAFHGGSDGAFPNELIGQGGTLYGATRAGGVAGCGSGCGTVFALGTDGTETLLHSFGPVEAGTGPQGRLLWSGNTLFGTTAYGGSNTAPNSFGYGTVFSVTRGGAFASLHSFTGTDGRLVQGGLISVGNLFYGTTLGGGASDNGVVYAISPRGAESVIYSFQGGLDASGPNNLVAFGNTLAGTSSFGGCIHLNHCGYGAGTVFSVTP